MDPVIQISVSLALAALWLVGALRKLERFREFGATVAEYRILPQAVVRPVAASVIALELALGLAVLVPSLRSAALVGSAGLLVLYGAAMAVNLVRGRRHIDCGCTGPRGQQPLDGSLVARNLVLAAGAVAASLPAEPRPLVWVDLISILGTVAALAVLYAVFNRLAVNARELAGLGG